MGGTKKRSNKKTMRKGPSSRAKKLYRKRVKGSKCRGMMTAKCRSSKSCKMALGKKRSFCRKTGNTKRPRYNLRSRKTKKGGKSLIKNAGNRLSHGLYDNKTTRHIGKWSGKTSYQIDRLFAPPPKNTQGTVK